VNILYVSQYFPPEMGAPAARVSELSAHWVKAGHTVTVLTGFPNHPTGVVPPTYRWKLWRLVWVETNDGIKIVRTWLLPFPNRGRVRRTLNYVSFFLSACLTGSFLHRPDVVIATSPQLLVGLAGRWIARRKHAPFVFEVRDLWPESLIAVGLSHSGSWFNHLLRRIADFLYRKCDLVVLVSPAFKDFLVDQYSVEAAKIVVVENGVETDLFTPVGIRATLGTQGKFVVAYIGTIGMAHGIETMIQAALELRTKLPDTVFLIVGEGAGKERLTSLAAEHQLRNLMILPQQPREKIPEIIRASDVCLVLLKKSDVFKTVLPSKMFELMACGRPVILGVEGQASTVLLDSGGGICIEPGNAAALAGAICLLHDDGALRQKLGSAGREYVVKKFSRGQKAAAYIQVLEKLLIRSERSAVSDN
jgi:glycosyltransferase involved in cell wall biosynthesis